MRGLAALVLGMALTAGGAAIFGYADQLSHEHPVNHVVEGPLIVTGVFAFLFGLVAFVAALSLWLDG